MTLREKDVHWLLTVDRFTKCEEQWEALLTKNLITPNLCERIDIMFKVLRRFLNTVPPTDEKRRKFYTQMIGLAFLMTKAELDLEIPLEYITI